MDGVPGGLSNVEVTSQKFGNVVILRCHGKIVRGQEAAILRAVAEQQRRDVILDLSQVDAIDAGGLGASLSLRAAGICLKLMDPVVRVREILSLTRLDSIFKICESESTVVMSLAMARPGDKSHACL
jgi:anti-anti-sigma factor